MKHIKKWRTSRFAKFLSCSLIIILITVIVLNAIGISVMMSENLYYANEMQLQQKAFTYLYDYTARDLLSYLYEAMYVNTKDDSYLNYHNSEFELFNEKYSPEKSNVYFEIKDEKGNLLLKNENTLEDSDYFSFSANYSMYDSYYDKSNWVRQESESITDILPTEVPSPDNLIIDKNDNGESENYDENTPSEQVTNNNDYSFCEADIPVAGVSEEVHIVYYFKDKIDYDIFAYCKDSIANLSYSHKISEWTYYQDEYTIDDESNIYLSKLTYDSSVPKKTVSTKLTCGEKTVTVNYSYFGSFDDNYFSEQLYLISLLLLNPENTQTEFSYTQGNTLRVNVSIYVPYTTSNVDIYGYASKAVLFAMHYRDNIITITVFAALLLLLLLIFIFYSAGYIPKYDRPVARGLHAIPIDLTCLILFASYFYLLTLFDLGFPMFLIGVGIALYLIYTSFVRIRANTFIKNTVIYKLICFITNALKIMSENINTRTKILLTALLYLLFTAFDLAVFLLFDFSIQMMIIIIALLHILLLPVLLYLLLCLITLHNGAKNISQGNIDYKILDKYLFGKFKQHAEYLGNINTTINNAVAERMKSENMKTELITNVSHDLKTPLTSIVNYVDLLKKENIDSPKAREYIEVIDRQSQRLKKLTVDIVEASKAATGNIEVHYEKLNLNVILLQTNGEYIEKLEEKQLTLVQEIPEEDIVINADGRLLWRVIDNLMNNICKYSLPCTRVYLNVSKNDGNAFISFRNISKNQLNIDPTTLTERFVRGDSSRNTEGSGLGLSIANSLTELMGGRLNVITDGDLFKVVISFPTATQ